MGLDDEREKLRQAEQWLAAGDIRGTRYQAALDHVRHVCLMAPADGTLRQEAAAILRDLPPLEVESRVMTYLNGVRTSEISCIYVQLEDISGTVYAVVSARPVVGPGLSTFGLGSYTSAANLESALSSFISDVGDPWVAVGSPSDIPAPWTNGEEGILAVNMDQAQAVTISDGASGYYHAGIKLSVYEQPSYGYAPWDSYADAATALSDMIRGTVTWSPSS